MASTGENASALLGKMIIAVFCWLCSITMKYIQLLFETFTLSEMLLRNTLYSYLLLLELEPSMEL